SGTANVQSTGAGGTVSVASGVNFTSTGALQVSTLNLANAGTLGSSSTLTVSTPGSLQVSGSGNLNGSSVALQAATGSVSFVSGQKTANNALTVTANTGLSLDFSSILASKTGNVSITAASINNAGQINANALGKSLSITNVAGVDLGLSGGGTLSGNTG